MTLVVPSPDRTTSVAIKKKDRSGKYKSAPIKPPTVAQLIALSETIALNRMGLTDPRSSNTRPRSVTEPMSLQDYTKLLAEIRTYNKLLEKKWSPNTVRRLGANMHDKLDRMIRDVDSARGQSSYYTYARNQDLSDMHFDVKSRDIYTELVALCRTFETRYDAGRKSLGVVTPPIVIVHPVIRGLRYNFGPAIIHIGPSYSTNVISPHTPRWAAGHIREYFHPHVRGGNRGTLCRGEGGTAIARAEKEGRYFDVVDMIIAILSTYGSNPYVRIEQWNGVCDEKFNPETGLILSVEDEVPAEVRPVVTCSGCGVSHDNPVSCFQSGCQYHNVCIGCLTRCQGTMPDESRCNQWLCEEHAWVCSNCGRNMCNSHFTLDEEAEVCDDCFRDNDE